ncbi:hypothetical protein [Mycolicibacterium komossense]|uniref:Transposase n=1 Tax=Mycolicibacterium komossense TaxID=1779 RepID=A0ABT3CFH1_9MYCO|nr:hypothetical protein [Mycolicibacterium komossense]MCV7228219.1 hypothetical protein [Mycolicibacterium komossense]
MATALGTEPMTLCNYVKGRDELEGLGAEAVPADVKHPPPCGDWLFDVSPEELAAPEPNQVPRSRRPPRRATQWFVQCNP